jgi:flagellar biosynthesis anti-sigma factor FlgM
MVDNISGFPNGPRSGVNKPKELDASGDDSNKSVADEAAGYDRQINADVVQLSAALQSELSRSEFDHEKVEQIKNAIAEGNYPIDGKRVAESFAAIEKLI